MAKGKTFQTTISLGGRVDGSLTKALNASKVKAADVAKAISKSTTTGMKAANKAVVGSFKSMATGALKLYGAVKAIAKLKDYASETITAAKAQLEVQTKLATVLSDVKAIQIRGPNAAAEAAKKLNEVSDALEKVGIIDGEVTLAGMQQLATYQLSDKEITTLSSGMDDLLAQQKGFNATQSDAVGIANMIGKAMTGNVGALSRVGITFTEAQAKAIKAGDATKRAAVLAEVLKQNVGGVNKALGETDQGQMVQAGNTFDDIKKTIGGFLLPLMNKLVQGVLPYAQKALEKLTVVLDKIGPVISGKIDKGFSSFADLLPVISQAITTILPLISGFISPLSMGSDLLPSLTSAIQSMLPVIVAIVKMIAPLIPQLIQQLIPALQSIIPAVINIIGQVLPVLISLIQELAPFIADLVKEIAPLVVSLFNKLFPAFRALLPPIIKLIKTILPVFVSLIKMIAPFIADLVAQLAPLIGALIEALMPAIQMLLPPIMQLVQMLLPPLKSLFTAIFGVIKSLTPIIAILARVIAVDFMTGMKVIGPILTFVIEKITGVMNILSSVINFIVNIFTGNWSAAWQNVKDIFSGIFNTFGDIAKVPLNMVIGLINTAIDGINGLTDIINHIPGVKIGKIPQIPYLAKGATVTGPTLAMIGEGKVPETVVPHNNAPRSRALLQEAARGVGIPITDSMSGIPVINRILSGLSYFADKYTQKPRNPKPSCDNSDSVSSRGNTYQFNFSPTVYANDKEGVKEVLEDKFEEFKRFVKQLRDEEGREVFA